MSIKNVIFTRLSFIIICTLVGAYILIGVMMPVSYDAGACSGGFRKWIVGKYQNRFEDLLEKKYNDFELVSSREQIIDSVKWSHYTIHVEISIKANNQDYRIRLNGRRYWFNRYLWSIEN